MFLSIPTYKGLQITVKSVIQLTKLLLGEGFESVLTERLRQDDVEDFGYQQAQGRRADCTLATMTCMLKWSTQQMVLCF